MFHHSMTSDRKAQFLRRNAENSLRTGSAPTGGTPLDGDTLTLLYRMASDPERSSDALRLLQELQVHQVELELQRTQLENNEREMDRELSYYRTLFDLTPTASLVVTMEGRIVEANPAAADLLGTGRGELAGRELLDFLEPESRASWDGLLRKLKGGEQPACCEVPALEGSSERMVTLRLSANVSPGDDMLLLTVADCGPVLHDPSIHQRSQ